MNSIKKKILIFTGTRADYGLLQPLIQVLSTDSFFQVELLVTGTHLSEKFGFSFKEIENDKFKINWKIDLDLVGDSELDTLNSMSIGLKKFGEVLLESKPDLAVVLGDRYEALSFAIACQIMKTPLAHIHGGEITEGAIDDSFRHSITKLSYLHFTAAEEYSQRVVQLGEAPERVFNVGALGVDNIHNLQLLSREELNKKLNIKFKKSNFLITLHPETLSTVSYADQITGLLSSLEKVKQTLNNDCCFIFTMPNSDPGHEPLFKAIHSFVSNNENNAISFTTMGRLNYLSAMSICDVVVGNSSSGIIEAPSFQVPTVNIGNRQHGRLRSISIFDTGFDSSEIYQTIMNCLEFKNKKTEVKNLFGDGHAANKIKDILKKLEYEKIGQKSFYDRN